MIHPYPCSQHDRESGRAQMSLGSGWAAVEFILCFGWKHEKFLPSQMRAIRGTLHFVFSVSFFCMAFESVTVQGSSCPESSAIQKRRLCCCVWPQCKDNSVSLLFISVSIQTLERLHLKVLISLPKKRKQKKYLVGKDKHSILMVSLQRFRNHWWKNFLLLIIFIFGFYLWPSV